MSVPVPPAELIRRVTGSPEADAFVRGGPWHLDAFARALERVGKTYGDFASIYDFGCGCGRITLPLRERAPQARIAASDIDEEAVGWLAENAPDVDARPNGGLPPLPYEDDSFDLVLAWSVFTHLPEDYQDAWLQELRRVTAPGAVLLLSVHGETNWRWTWREPLASRRWSPTRARLALLRRHRGFAHWRGDGWDALFPDYYHTTWHTHGYIRERWSRWFEVADIAPGEGPEHDIVVMRRPGS
ncbi:MAG: class I SAM-dependent methyltransferase [Actinobacteria bacterium]|nr:class I SAM-dependent methyltransferase [Actinomycetota bacterium]